MFGLALLEEAFREGERVKLETVDQSPTMSLVNLLMLKTTSNSVVGEELERPLASQMPLWEVVEFVHCWLSQNGREKQFGPVTVEVVGLSVRQQHQHRPRKRV